MSILFGTRLRMETEGLSLAQVDTLSLVAEEMTQNSAEMEKLSAAYAKLLQELKRQNVGLKEKDDVIFDLRREERSDTHDQKDRQLKALQATVDCQLVDLSDREAALQLAQLENARLADQHAGFKASRNDQDAKLKREIGSMQDEIDRLRDALERKDADAVGKETQIAGLRGQMERMQLDFENQKSDPHEKTLRRQLEAAEVAAERATGESNERDLQAKRLEAALRGAEATAEEASGIAKRSKREADDLKAQLDQALDEANNLRNQVEDNRRALAESEDSSRLAGSAQKVLRRDYDNVRHQLDELQAERDEAVRLRSESEQSRQDAVAELGPLRRLADELKSELVRSQEAAYEAQENQESAEKRLGKAKAASKALQRESDELRAALDKAVQDALLASEKQAQAESWQKRSAQEAKALRNEVDDLRQQLDSAHDSTQALQGRAEAAVRQAEVASTAAKRDIAEAQRAAAEAEDAAQEAERQLKEARHATKEATRDADNVAADLKTARDQLLAAKNGRDDAEEALQQALSERKELKRANDELQAQRDEAVRLRSESEQSRQDAVAELGPLRRLADELKSELVRSQEAAYEAQENQEGAEKRLGKAKAASKALQRELDELRAALDKAVQDALLASEKQAQAETWQKTSAQEAKALRSELDDMRSELDSAHESMQALQDRHDRVEATARQAEAAAAAAKRDIAEAQRAAAEAEDAAQEAERQLKEARHATKEATRDADNVAADLKTARDQLLAAKNGRDDAEEALQQALSERKELKRAKDEVRRALSDAKDELEDKGRRLEGAESQAKFAEERLRQAQNERRKTARDYAEYQEEVADKLRLHDDTIARCTQLEANLRDADDALRDMTQRQSNFTQQLEDADIEVSSLKRNLASKNADAKENAAETSRLTQRLQELEDELAEALGRVDRTDRQVDRAQQDLNFHKATMKAENARQAAALDDVSAKARDAIQNAHAQRTENVRLQSKNGSLANRNEDLEAEKERLLDDVKRMRAELDATRVIDGELQVEIRKLELVNNQKEQANLLLKEKLHERQLGLHSERQQVEHLADAVQKATDRLRGANDSIDKVMDENDKLRTRSSRSLLHDDKRSATPSPSSRLSSAYSPAILPDEVDRVEDLLDKLAALIEVHGWDREEAQKNHRQQLRDAALAADGRVGELERTVDDLKARWGNENSARRQLEALMHAQRAEEEERKNINDAERGEWAVISSGAHAAKKHYLRERRELLEYMESESRLDVEDLEAAEWNLLLAMADDDYNEQIERMRRKAAAKKTAYMGIEVSEGITIRHSRDKDKVGRLIKDGKPVLTDLEGVKVYAVTRNAPAEVAGLLEDDIITHFNENPVKSLSDFKGCARQVRPGGVVHLNVWRNGTEETKVIIRTLEVNEDEFMQGLRRKEKHRIREEAAFQEKTLTSRTHLAAGFLSVLRADDDRCRKEGTSGRPPLPVPPPVLLPDIVIAVSGAPEIRVALFESDLESGVHSSLRSLRRVILEGATRIDSCSYSPSELIEVMASGRWVFRGRRGKVPTFEEGRSAEHHAWIRHWPCQYDQLCGLPPRVREEPSRAFATPENSFPGKARPDAPLLLMAEPISHVFEYIPVDPYTATDWRSENPFHTCARRGDTARAVRILAHSLSHFSDDATEARVLLSLEATSGMTALRLALNGGRADFVIGLFRFFYANRGTPPSPHRFLCPQEISCVVTASVEFGYVSVAKFFFTDPEGLYFSQSTPESPAARNACVKKSADTRSCSPHCSLHPHTIVSEYSIVEPLCTSVPNSEQPECPLPLPARIVAHSAKADIVDVTSGFVDWAADFVLDHFLAPARASVQLLRALAKQSGALHNFRTKAHWALVGRNLVIEGRCDVLREIFSRGQAGDKPLFFSALANALRIMATDMVAVCVRTLAQKLKRKHRTGRGADTEASIATQFELLEVLLDANCCMHPNKKVNPGGIPLNPLLPPSREKRNAFAFAIETAEAYGSPILDLLLKKCNSETLTSAAALVHSMGGRGIMHFPPLAYAVALCKPVYTNMILAAGDQLNIDVLAFGVKRHLSHKPWNFVAARLGGDAPNPFPIEVWHRVCGFLEAGALGRVEMTSRGFHDLITESNLWNAALDAHRKQAAAHSLYFARMAAHDRNPLPYSDRVKNAKHVLQHAIRRGVFLCTCSCVIPVPPRVMASSATVEVPGAPWTVTSTPPAKLRGGTFGENGRRGHARGDGAAHEWTGRTSPSAFAPLASSSSSSASAADLRTEIYWRRAPGPLAWRSPPSSSEGQDSSEDETENRDERRFVEIDGPTRYLIHPLVHCASALFRPKQSSSDSHRVLQRQLLSVLSTEAPGDTWGHAESDASYLSHTLLNVAVASNDGELLAVAWDLSGRSYLSNPSLYLDLDAGGPFALALRHDADVSVTFLLERGLCERENASNYLEKAVKWCRTAIVLQLLRAWEGVGGDGVEEARAEVPGLLVKAVLRKDAVQVVRGVLNFFVNGPSGVLLKTRTEEFSAFQRVAGYLGKHECLECLAVALVPFQFDVIVSASRAR
ncbi:Extracellular matrix-binding protein ebh [Diplonema papillatum]|nr:Extracellular matrix-binding protein ebh [Diplonema papillatum]